MAEFIDATALAPQAAINEATPWYHKWEARAAGVFLTFGITACGAASANSRSTSANRNTPAFLTGAQAVQCNNIAELSQNLADTDTSIPEAFFPQLYTTDNNGDHVLVSEADATTSLRKQICGDYRSLAIVSAILELRDPKHVQFPTENIISRIEELASTYTTNAQAASDAETNAFDALTFLKATSTFGVTENQSTVITAQRNANHKVTGLDAKQGTSSSSLQGFVLSYNNLDPNLTSTEKSQIDKFDSLVLFKDDGTIVFNSFVANKSFKFDKNAPQQPVSPNSSTSSSTVELGNGGNTGSGPQGQAGTGGSAGPNGTNAEAGPGGVTSSPANGSGSGSTPNTAPGNTLSTSPNTAPSTTSATTPNTAPPTPTTKVTVPPTSSTTKVPPPPPPSSTTSTTGNKGTVPVCVNNPPYVIC